MIAILLGTTGYLGDQQKFTCVLLLLTQIHESVMTCMIPWMQEVIRAGIGTR